MLGIQAALGPRLRGDERTLVASFADCATALARPSPALVFRLAMVLPFMHLQPCGGPRGRRKRFRRSVAQWLEHRSPKPGVGGSSPPLLPGVVRLGHQSLDSAMGCGRTPRGRQGRYQVSSMAKISPFKFLQEVRAEAQKVTWPSRRETAVTTAMVFVMVAVASIFFLVADQFMRMFITLVLGIGG